MIPITFIATADSLGSQQAETELERVVSEKIAYGMALNPLETLFIYWDYSGGQQYSPGISIWEGDN